jgi:hypothetical protein
MRRISVVDVSGCRDTHSPLDAVPESRTGALRVQTRGSKGGFEGEVIAELAERCI